MKASLSVASAVLALAMASGSAAPPVAAQSKTPKAASVQRIDEEYTKADQAEPAGSAHHDRARRSPAGVRHGSVSAEVPRPRRRHARRAHLREGHPSLLRGAGEGGAEPREVLEGRHHRRRARHRAARDRRRGDDQVARQVPRHARRADRSAQDDRGARPAAAADGEADLLRDQRHALARERRPRDADRARLPSDRRGDAVHPEHPQQRHHAHHAGD